MNIKADTPLRNICFCVEGGNSVVDGVTDFNELLPVTGYKPDFDALRNSGVKISIGCGEYGLKKNACYVEFRLF